MLSAILVCLRWGLSAVCQLRSFQASLIAQCHSLAVLLAQLSAPSTELAPLEAHDFSDVTVVLVFFLGVTFFAGFIGGYVFSQWRLAPVRAHQRVVDTQSGAVAPRARGHSPNPAASVKPHSKLSRPLRRVDADPPSPLPKLFKHDRFPVGLVLSPTSAAAPSAKGGQWPR